MKDVDRMSGAIASEKPDYICLLGDLVDSPKEIESRANELKTLITNCSSIAPTMLILGSHDFIDEDSDEYKDVLLETSFWEDLETNKDVHLLNDKVFQDDNIFIAGYRQKRDAYYNLVKEHKEDAASYKQDFITKTEIWTTLPTDLPKILLTHSPEPIQSPLTQALIANYDVTITGHYHNGCIPIILDDILNTHSGLITPKKDFFPKHARGIVRLDEEFYKAHTNEFTKVIPLLISDYPPYLIYNGGWTKIQDCAPQILHWLDKVCYRQLDVTTLTPNEEYLNKPNIYSKRTNLKK